MTTRRYRITHKTVLGYAGNAIASHNELRMAPVSESGQTTLESRIRVWPMTWSQVYRDSWGTHVMTTEAITDHASLTVEAVSTVELHREEPSSPGDVSWERLASADLKDFYYEWLSSTKQTVIGEDLREAVAQLRHGTPAQTTRAVVDFIRSQLTYEQGVTQVQSSAQDAWSARTGVCQDFAHICIGSLRSLGIPARYVSGYLVPREDLGIGESSEGESHAWLEAWLGEWVAFDPTNDRPILLDHIIVGRGRDYSDVPPLKGVYSGPKVARHEVGVSFSRLG
ncbi:MAG: transglutaminase domain-containing protein [Actinomycetales bacterium]